MADLGVRVRLTGESGQLVGQLNSAATAESKVADSAQKMGQAAEAASRSSDRQAAAAARAEAAMDGLAQAQATAKRATDAAKAAYQAGEINLASYNRMLLASKANVDVYTRAHTQAQRAIRSTSGAAQAGGAGLQGLGMQFADFTQQVSLGSNVFLAFGQQAGQAAYALSSLEGTAGTVGRFFAGPWGALVLAGVTVLGMFITRTNDAKAAGDNWKEGMDYQKLSVSALTAAIGELEAAQRKQIRTSYDSEQASLADANAALGAAKAKRAQAAAEILLAQAEMKRTQGIDIGAAMDPMQQAQNARTGSLSDSAVAGRILGGLDKTIALAEKAQREAMVPVERREAGAATDAAAAATLRYDKAESALSHQLVAGQITAAKYRSELEKLITTRDRDIKAAQKAEQQSRSTVQQFGREIDSAEAKSIAMQAGFTVTSGDRTRERQQWLYDHKRTAANPVALPGTSAHERGNALDIAFGAGVTPAAIKAAFAKEGVTLTKLLKETGHFHIEWSTKGADKVEREADQLATFGQNAAASIEAVNQRFADQPKLIGQANLAVAQLDRTIAELRQKQPPGFEALIASAQEAKGVVEQSLLRPFNDYLQAQQRSADIQSLVAAGRQDEAAALRVIYQLQDQVGVVTREQRQTILDTVRAEREHNELLEHRNVLASAYTSAISDARSQVEKLLSGATGIGGFLKGLQQNYRQLQARVLTEQLLGPLFRDLEKTVQERTGIQSSVDIFKAGTESAGKAGDLMASALEGAAARVDRTFGGSVDSPAAGGSAFDQAFAGFGLAAGPATPVAQDAAEAAQETADNTGEIVVTARKTANGVMGLTPAQFSDLLAGNLVAPFVDGLKGLLGDRLGGQVANVATGAIAGYMRAGPVGAVLSGLQKIDGLPDSISKGLGKAMKGAETGTATAGIMKALGIKTSTTGAQLGGAIGSAIPIPGGQIIGSILGGLVGGLFKKTKTGSITLGNVNGVGGITGTGGNSGAIRDQLSSVGGQINGALQTLVSQLGGTLGNYSVAIGQRKDYYRVSASGNAAGAAAKHLNRSDIIYDGKDEAAAVSAALANAIADGAVQGLSAAVNRAVQANAGNIDKALSEALATRDLESKLGGFVGAAKHAFEQFELQAKDRLRIATAYGLEINKVEELNAKDRIKLREQLERESFGSLQDLLDRMRSGDLFEGSAVDQRNILLGKIDAARTKAAAGEDGAADELAKLLEQLNAVSKDVFGTAGGFAGDRSQIETTAESVISVLRSQLDDAQGLSNPQLTTTNNLLDEANDTLAAQLAALRALVSGQSNPTLPAPTAPPIMDVATLAYTGTTRTGARPVVLER